MLKRTVTCLLAVLLLAAIAIPSLAAGAMQQGSMYVNTANGKALRFRSSRSTSADNVLVEIPYGTKVYVISWDGTWARIRYNSAVGYVVKKHLSIARPEPYQEKEQKKEQEQAVKEQEKELKAANSKLDRSKLKSVELYDVTVRTGVQELNAPVYEKASLLSKVLKEYPEGTRLVVTAKNKDWAAIYDGSTELTGYMLLEELEEDLVEDEILDDE